MAGEGGRKRKRALALAEVVLQATGGIFGLQGVITKIIREMREEPNRNQGKKTNAHKHFPLHLLEETHAVDLAAPSAPRPPPPATPLPPWLSYS